MINPLNIGATLNYIGSKYRLLPFVRQAIFDMAGDIHDLTLADLFAGTGVVGRSFVGEVKRLIVNDLEAYSYTVNRGYLADHNSLVRTQELLEELNLLEGVSGKIYHFYCMGGGNGRQYFSDENGRKIDAMRQQIEVWHVEQTINTDQYYFLLARLLETADKVANTASVYGAFLKHLKKSAQKPLILAPLTSSNSSQLALFRGKIFSAEANSQAIETVSEVYQQDANELIKKISGDVLYLDPPYNARQYGANYHLLNTIALYDDFTPKGKTGLREYRRSEYCQTRKVLPSFESLIQAAQFRYIFLSYNNEGLMSLDEVKTVMERYGEYELRTQDYQRFKADRDENRNHKATRTEEYLHILVKW
ncbi:DNA adenine methylase [Anaerolineales bacterium HSG25]|nr:DNA adenine methylase [Anaerolineales bacterium HSG25]